MLPMGADVREQISIHNAAWCSCPRFQAAYQCAVKAKVQTALPQSCPWRAFLSMDPDTSIPPPHFLGWAPPARGRSCLLPKSSVPPAAVLQGGEGGHPAMLWWVKSPGCMELV